MITIQRTDGRKIILSDRHKPYVSDVEQDFERYFAELKSKDRVLDFSHAGTQEYKNGETFLFTSFPEEANGCEMYFHHFKPTGDELIFDFGAYCGATTCKMAAQVKKVIAYEPDPESFSALIENARDVMNVEIYRQAVSSQSGEMEFFNEAALGSALRNQNTRPGSSEFISVRTTTLESEVIRFGIPVFVKMDIEGAEVEVLDSSRTLLRSHAIREFAVDTNHFKNGVSTAEKVSKIFSKCGYETLTSDQYGYLTTWAWR